MACSYFLTKPSPMLFSFLSFLLLSLSNSVLCSIHHKPKLAQAPAPALVGATPPAPVEATPTTPSPASALAPVEAPTQDCSPYAQGLLECLDYLQAGSTDAKPEASCCSDLRAIAKQDVSCLCALLTGNQDDFGFQINSSRVLSLPYTCSFSLPTSSKCTALLGPPTIAAVPVPSASHGLADVTSPPLPPESLAAAIHVTIFTIAAGIVVSTLSLIA